MRKYKQMLEEVVFYFVVLVSLIGGFIAAFSPEKIRDLNIKLYQRMPDPYGNFLIKCSSHPLILLALRLSGIILLIALFMLLWAYV